MIKRRALLNLFLSLLILISVLSYPFLIYHYIEQISPAWFASALLTLLIVRFYLTGDRHRLEDWLILLIMSIFCALVIWINSEQLLKFYPLLMNIGIGMTFLLSLTKEQCLIDKFARLGGKQPPPEAYGYLRTLTLLWGCLLLLNGAVSAYTAWYSSLSVWTFYNGVLSYVLIGCFAAGEWVYRGFYKKKNNIIDD